MRSARPQHSADGRSAKLWASVRPSPRLWLSARTTQFAPSDVAGDQANGSLNCVSRDVRQTVMQREADGDKQPSQNRASESGNHKEPRER
jgi:hypothetical protein